MLSYAKWLASSNVSSKPDFQSMSVGNHLRIRLIALYYYSIRGLGNYRLKLRELETNPPTQRLQVVFMFLSPELDSVEENPTTLLACIDARSN